jgi:hypothetical protein
MRGGLYTASTETADNELQKSTNWVYGMVKLMMVLKMICIIDVILKPFLLEFETLQSFGTCTMSQRSRYEVVESMTLYVSSP